MKIKKSDLVKVIREELTLLKENHNVQSLANTVSNFLSSKYDDMSSMPEQEFKKILATAVSDTLKNQNLEKNRELALQVAREAVNQLKSIGLLKGKTTQAKPKQPSVEKPKSAFGSIKSLFGIN